MSRVLSGPVIRGDRLGRKLGFPTANLRIPASRLPPRGVYKVLVSGGPFKEPRPAVCNIGVRPTLGGKPLLRVEVHIPGFKGSLYGKRLTAAVGARIRGERRFPSLAALKARIRLDLKALRKAPPGQKASRKLK